MKGYLVYSELINKYQLRYDIEGYQDLNCGYPLKVKINDKWIKGSLEMDSKKEYYLLSGGKKIGVWENMEAKLLW